MKKIFKALMSVSILLTSVALADGNSVSAKPNDLRVKYIGASRQLAMPSLGIVSPVLSRPNQAGRSEAIGVLTRVCLSSLAYLNNRPESSYTSYDQFYRDRLWAKVPQDRGYAITPSHVAQRAIEPGRSSLKTLNGDTYHVEFVDSAGDLALLSYQNHGQPCGVLSVALKVSMAYDVEAAILETPRMLEIEAPDLGAHSWTSHRHAFESLLAVTNEFALSGRDLSGPLLMTLAKGYRGQSGGALMGFQAAGGDFADNEARSSTDASFLRRVLGMILAVDPEGQRLVSLPAPTIVRKIRGFYGGYWKPEQNSIAVKGGTLYPEISAVHLRGWVDDAGTGTLGDSGTGTLGDSGTGTLADSGLANWVKSRGGQMPSSGLMLGGQIWRELWGWSEFEPVSVGLRSALLKSSADGLSGVYETIDGQLFLKPSAHHIAQPLKGFLSPALLISHFDSERFVSSRPIRVVDKIPCFFVSGAERLGKAEYLRVRPVLYCEGYQPSVRTQTRILAWHDAQDSKSPVHTIRFDYQLQCPALELGKACPLKVTAQHFSGASDGLEWSMSMGGFSDALVEVRESMIHSQSHKEQLTMRGLRYATGAELHVGLFLSGGFRVRQTMAVPNAVTLVGPAQSGLLNYRRELIIDPETEN